ncbi:hypothetical protein [Haloferula sp. BvORR071]|uniref:hypothetical protein n=1 Tax=Haloferula sp. BvORR071 TaxID=1396141 RepID=UPI0005560B2C|nr:hypothetical protein [Haloferula sp. BvORR071]
MMKSERKGRARAWGAIVLLLVATHLGAYLVARSLGRSGGDGNDAGVADAAERAWAMPGKSVDRERDDVEKRLAGLGPAGFRRLLGELEQPGSGLSREDFLLVREELFREWLRRDLVSAMDVLWRPESGWRYAEPRSSLYRELKEEISRHPDEVAGWIAERRYGSNTMGLVMKWSETLLEQGQVAVVLEHLDLLPGELLRGTLPSLARQANAEQLAQVGARLDLLGEDAGGADVVNAYAERKLRLGKDDPAAIFAGEESGKMREALATMWVVRESANLPPRDAVAVLMKFPAELREQSALGMMEEERRGGYAARAELLDALDGQGLVGEIKGHQAWKMIEDSQAEEMRPEWDKGTPAKLLELARVIQRDDLRHYFLQQAMWDPAYARVDDLLAVLPGLPAGGDRDALVAGMAGLSYLGPELRGKLLEWVGDERLREKVRTEMSGEDGIPRGPVPDF